MFDIFKHKANTNQNDTEIPSHPIRMANIKTNGRYGIRRTLINCPDTVEINMEFPQKVKNKAIQLLYNSWT
jgi:hypothetical protein